MPQIVELMLGAKFFESVRNGIAAVWKEKAVIVSSYRIEQSCNVIEKRNSTVGKLGFRAADMQAVVFGVYILNVKP